MNVLSVVSKVLEKVSYPIRSNFYFFFFMYLVGIVVSYAELPANREDASVYGNLWLELFFDLYIVCILLSLIPKRVRRWVVRAFYIIAYATSIADLFCWVKFQSSLNPSMLLLAAETDKREASEFFSSYINSEVLASSVGLLLLIIIMQCLVAVWNIYRKRKGIKYPVQLNILKEKSADFIGIIALVFFVVSAISSYHNKREMVQMFSLKTIGDVEHELTTPDCATFYTPVYRLVFSLYANHLAAQQIDRLVEAKDRATVQSCTFGAKNIVLIIGESMGPHHSQQYGYFMNTTPRQVALEKSGLLVPFSDVVAPWNLTSFVFKNIFSMHVVGQKGEWCDYPLFPQLFRKAGYHVSFITNQFLPQAKEAVYDFSGGFFLNHKELSESMFDTRNTHLHTFDEGLLADYDNKLKAENKENNLIIFHLIGSHVSYNRRYPKSRKHFKAADYEQKRPELTELGRFMLAPFGLLVTKVTHKKQTYRTYLGVDASAVNLLRPAMYGSYHHITNMDQPEGETEIVDVVGSLCENNDKFAINRPLPISQIGDTLVIHDTGAHGFSMGYQYNAKLRSSEILLEEDGNVRMIRRAERPEDYFATLYGFDFEK